MLAEYSGWHFVHDNPAVDLDPPANGRLAEIHAPTLVVVGDRDLPFYNRLIADRLAQAIPGARQVVIPGAGHMANMEEPAAFNRAVLDFLASLDSRL